MFNTVNELRKLKPPRPSFCRFCQCNTTDVEVIQCKCGEDYNEYDWVWGDISRGALLAEDNCQVYFHENYSSGTAVVRGGNVLKRNYHHYWEIKILTRVYGTDVMIGVGSENVNFKSYSTRFCKMLAMEKESYGYSFRGTLGHDNNIKDYGPEFGQGSIIGVHLDMCAGTLEFYHNRKSLGIAYTGLKHLNLYPMVCSTAAHTSIRLINSLCMPPNLQFECIRTLRHRRTLKQSIDIIPGLGKFLQKQYWWMMTEPAGENIESEDVDNIETSDKDQDYLILVYGKRRRDFFSTSKVKKNPVWDEIDKTECDESLVADILKEDDQKVMTQCHKCDKKANTSTRKIAHHFSCNICLEF